MSIKIQNPKSKTQLLAWQGWTLTIPDTWNPVKVDGDFDKGSILLADLHAAKLGLRWKRAGNRGDPADWAKRAIRDEVGQLASEEAVDFAMPGAADWSASRLFVERDPPGRDIWVGHSVRSNRVLQIAYHTDRRSQTFTDSILPTLADTLTDAEKRWSVFDLSFTTPPGVRVQWYRFNAGDLSVGLASDKRRVTVVRQIGPAGLALARQPLERWLTQQQASTRKLYRPIESTSPTTIDLPGRNVAGLRGDLLRKRRLWWAWMVARQQTVLAFHDAARDRVVIGQSQDEAALRATLATVGWAKPGTPAATTEAA